MSTFYVDSDNGTNTYTGLEITGTIDSSADSTHFVDSALTGADDYINGSFLYNVTTGAGTLILDFDAASDTVTLTDADGSMASGDTYYILHAFADLHKFTETARNAGDIVILRRGMTARYDDGGDLAFTSDGTIDNPITIEADYANKWRDDVDLSATGTATLTFGSKTITFSSDISGVCAAGDWIYVASEDAKEFAYEVAVVSTVTVTLFLPYKGDQAGSGKTMTNMQDPPIWNTSAGNFEWNFDADDFWKVQGIHIRGADGNGIVEIDSCAGHIFKDCIFQTSGSSACIKNTDDGAQILILKSRMFDYVSGFSDTAGAGGQTTTIKDCLFDGDNNSGGEGINTNGWNNYSIEESEFKKHQGADIEAIQVAQRTALIKGRNVLFSSTTAIGSHENQEFGHYIFEDHNKTLNETTQFTGFSTAESTPIFQSETTKVRSGGSTISIKVTPSTKVSTNWEFGRVKLFELPIYATTDSKTYTVYFASDTTTEWTASPLATELWIELEAWGHASNNFRRITKSTGTVDMTTDTDFDQTLTVTVAPAQAGVAYLRCYYAKTKESSKTNIFYVDPIPEIA